MSPARSAGAVSAVRWQTARLLLTAALLAASQASHDRAQSLSIRKEGVARELAHAVAGDHLLGGEQLAHWEAVEGAAATDDSTRHVDSPGVVSISRAVAIGVRIAVGVGAFALTATTLLAQL